MNLNNKHIGKVIKFRAEHFGGYNIFMWLTGIFSGLAFAKSWFFLIGTVISFIGSCYYYAKSQETFKEEEEEDYIDVDCEERTHFR